MDISREGNITLEGQNRILSCFEEAVPSGGQ
jgi:hypothetical protein